MGATLTTSLVDPLLCLRQSIASGTYPTPSASTDSLEATDDLAIATHLHFNSPNTAVFALETPTRFISADKPVDLRSIFFAWQSKDVAIPEYIASAQALNEALSAPGGAGGRVQNLVFVERLDLITWLESASDESEYIKALEVDSTQAQAASSAQTVSGAVGGTSALPAGAGARQGRTIDPRLQQIYNNERRMGDRNTVLRGIKPTDFSHVRKSAEIFLSRHRQKPGAASTAAPGVPSTLVSLPKKANQRPNPIILLSPSASSLLRMSNIKSFLDDGLYTPPDSASSATLLHISRLLPSVDEQRPMRFILVDTPEQFKPDYWNRVVAVFTTGQAWQFKGYKWQEPRELFQHILGVYVGWKGENLPESVKGWGRGVLSVGVDKWSAGQSEAGRWRDREIVEGVWGAIEENMRRKGWGREGR